MNARAQRFGGYALLVMAGLFLWATVNLLVLTPAAGLSTPNAPYLPAPGMSFRDRSPLAAIEALLTLVYAACVLLFSEAVAARLRAAAPFAASLSWGLGVVVCAVNLFEGMVSWFGWMIVQALRPEDQAVAEIGYVAITIMHDVALFAGILGLGVWQVLVHGAALRTGTLPRGVCWLGLLTGTQATLAFLVPPLALPVLHIAWALWLGITLLRQSDSTLPKAGAA